MLLLSCILSHSLSRSLPNVSEESRYEEAEHIYTYYLLSRHDKVNNGAPQQPQRNVNFEEKKERGHARAESRVVEDVEHVIKPARLVANKKFVKTVSE